MKTGTWCAAAYAMLFVTFGLGVQSLPPVGAGESPAQASPAIPGAPALDQGTSWPWQTGGQELHAGNSITLTSSRSRPRCGSKTTCAEMSSCEEAMYFLNQCGQRRLDRDGDGIPCESGPC